MRLRLCVQLSRAQKASARAEEERQIALMMSYSAEQDHIRAMRIAEEREAEERALRQVLLQSRRDKGKGRQQETDEERRQLELVMQLSLEEAARRRGSGQTSAEVFERLSRSGFVVEENQSEGRRRTPPRIQSSTSSARVSHSLFNNPSSPSVSSPGPISSRPTPSTQPDIHPDIANPPPAYEYPVAPEPSPGLEEEYSRTVILGPGRPLSQDPNLPTASTSAQRAASPPLPPLPSSSPSRPSLSTRTSSYASQSSAPGASAFYSTAVAAATSSHPRLRPPFSTTTTTESVSGSTILVNSPSPVSAAVEAEDPFDEQFAAVDPLPGDFAEEGGAANGDERAGKDLWELTHGSRRSPASVVSTDGAASTTEPFNERLLTPSTTMFDPNRSSTSLSPSTTSFEDRRSSPLWGGLVDTSSANAIADETVLSGVKFGFVPVARRAQHPPLEHQGAFPDVAQLSRMGGSEGDSQEYTSFAVEASSWKTLLTYLMWCVPLSCFDVVVESDRFLAGTATRISKPLLATSKARNQAEDSNARSSSSSSVPSRTTRPKSAADSTSSPLSIPTTPTRTDRPSPPPSTPVVPPSRSDSLNPPSSPSLSPHSPRLSQQLILSLGRRNPLGTRPPRREHCRISPTRSICSRRLMGRW